MSKRNSKISRTKRSKFLAVLGAILLSMTLLFVLFAAVDNFTMYWFILLNQDGVSERRRAEDFSWYSGSSGSYVPSEPGSDRTDYPEFEEDTGRLFTEKYNMSDPYEVMRYVESTMSDEELQGGETFIRFLIYYMDANGYVPNAIIAAIANSEGEISSLSGGKLGCWTYEGDWSGRTGPDGEMYSTVKDNEGWLQWIEDHWSSPGLGFFQWTRGRGQGLVNAAISQNTFWQSPSFQINYFFTVEEQSHVWGNAEYLDPGVDPKTSYDVTAHEWVQRLFTNEMHGGGSCKPTTCEANHAHSGNRRQVRFDSIDAATEMYNKYSHTDEWFYNDRAIDPSSWMYPFGVAAYDNSTSGGRLFARLALLLASGNGCEGDTTIPMGEVWGYDAPNLVACGSLRYYREALHALESGTTYYASCDRGVATVIHLAGADPDFPWGGTEVQYNYLTGAGKDKWKDLGLWKDIKNESLQPGDILITEGSGHIKMYIGENIAGERWPGTTANMYQASYGEHYPFISRQEPSGTSRVYRAFRYVGNSFTSDGWDTFMSAIGDKLPELPRMYVGPDAVTYGDPQTQTPVVVGSWAWPLPSDCTHVSSFFGTRVHPLRKVVHEHGGTDLPAPANTPITATRAGTVKYVGWDEGGYGWYCSIDHGDGCVTYYAHQIKKPIVSAGDAVSQGQVIGYVGTTGSSTGNHLHFELRVDGTRADVLDYFKGMTLQAKDANDVYQDFVVE